MDVNRSPGRIGKVGTIGCSSTAEWQMAVAAQGNPAFTTMIPQGFGAGVGRVGPYYEQGNWYRGGAVQMLFIAWLYGEQNQVRPMFPPNTSQEDLIRASKSFDLAQQAPPVDWSKALRHLARQWTLSRAVDGPRGIFADEMPVPTGGAMIKRAPNDPAWYKGGLVARQHEDQCSRILVYVLVRRFGRAESGGLQPRPQNGAAGDRRQAIRRDRADAALQPINARPKTRSSANASMGDARLDYSELTYGWFDHFLKGEKNDILERCRKCGISRWGATNGSPRKLGRRRARKPMKFYPFERRQGEHLKRRRRT